MKTSVIITTFNRPDTLKEAVESVLNQSLLPFEIIIINDGKEFPTSEGHLSHPLVTIVRNARSRGANFSRNAGAKLSKGDILMFLDDDDTWEKDKIVEQLSHFENNPSIGLVYSGRRMVYDTNRSKEIYRVPANKSGILYPEILKKNLIGTTSSVAVKRDVFFEAGGFDEKFPAMQDYDLWIRVCQLVPVSGDGKYNVKYTLNQHPKSAQISNSGNNQEIAGELILDKYSLLYKQEGISVRKRRSRMYFYVAKAHRSKNFKRALYFAAKSFCTFPNLPSLAIVFLKDFKRR